MVFDDDAYEFFHPLKTSLKRRLHKVHLTLLLEVVRSQWRKVVTPVLTYFRSGIYIYKQCVGLNVLPVEP